MKIKVITGGAGTGKTQHLISSVFSEFLSKKFSDINEIIRNSVILAPTHSAVMNIKRRLDQYMKEHESQLYQLNRTQLNQTLSGSGSVLSNSSNSSILSNSSNSSILSNSFNIATIYSYFMIDWKHEKVIGAKHYHPYIYIDEFGLIKKELFNEILSKLRRAEIDNHITISLTIAGDVVQLSPIYTETRMISFKKLKKYYDSVRPYIVEHDFNSIFSLKEIKYADTTLLHENRRSENSILSLIIQLFYDRDISVIKTISTTTLISLIMNEGYTYLSGRYDQQINIYNLIKSNKLAMDSNAFVVSAKASPFKELLFFDHAKFVVTETNRSFRNGEILEFQRKSGKIIVMKRLENDEEFHIDPTSDAKVRTSENLNGDLKLVPSMLLTIHKSQGLSIEKVVVNIEDLFDPCMLYTACTRAVKDLKFYGRKNDEELRKYIEEFYGLLKYYGYVEK